MYTPEQRKAHIREMQTYLHRLACAGTGIPAVVPDGIYGPETEQAVRAFQRLYGLTETGEVNGATWEKLVSVCRLLTESPPEPLPVFPTARSAKLRPGDTGLCVCVVQAILHTMAGAYANLPDVPMTGTYDADTLRAVQLFQKLCCLPVTGDVDCATWNMLVTGAVT